MSKFLRNRLHSIPAAAVESKAFGRWPELIDCWDRNPPEDGAAAYRALTEEAAEISPVDGEGPLQVDMCLRLAVTHVSRAVGEQAALAAEILLQLTPQPSVDPVLASYRQAFLSRYGRGVEVPLLEMLHPEIGLGPIPWESSGVQAANDRQKPAGATRDRILYDLALNAVRDGVVANELERKDKE